MFQVSVNTGAQEVEEQYPDFLENQQHISAVDVKDLYLLMGRELEALDEVPAGNVLGIGGLEQTVLKSGTLASTLACPAFTDMYFDAAPIVRVAVEPAYTCEYLMVFHVMSRLILYKSHAPCRLAYLYLLVQFYWYTHIPIIVFSYDFPVSCGDVLIFDD